MNILTLVARNSRRKPLRSLVLVLVLAVGTAAVVCLWNVSQVVGSSMEEKLLAYGANILITPKRDTLSVSYGGFHMGDLQVDARLLDQAEVADAVRSIELGERISAVAPKLVTMVQSGGQSLGVVGVLLDEELRIKNYWGVNGSWPQDEGDLLLGSEAAARLGLGPGDRVELMGREFRVAGTLMPTGGDDDRVAFADIGAVQELTDQQGLATFVEVAALCSGCPIEDIVDQIAAALPGVEVNALKSVMEQRMFTISFVERLVLAMGGVILLCGLGMIFLSMLAAVAERRKEIGVLRSLGFSKAGVFTIFCGEALVLGLVAGIAGVAGGVAAGYPVLRALELAGAGDNGLGTAMNLPWTAMVLVILGVGLAASLAAAAPAWKAARLEPSKALTAL